MANGKTNYQFPLNGDKQIIEQIIQNWLNANDFKFIQDNEGSFYRSGDAVFLGYRFFEYSFENNQINIFAYVGSPKNPRALKGIVGAIAIMSYKDTLESLIASLNVNNIQQNPSINQNQENQFDTQQQLQTNNSYNDFQQNADKKKNLCAKISFWVSIFLLLTSFLRISLSGIVIVVNYYLAVRGLKSNKRKKAIAALIMTSLSIIVLILSAIISR